MRVASRPIHRGLVLVLAGMLLVAAGVVSAKRAHATVSNVYLIITASDSQSGRFPTGSNVVQTVTVTNSSNTGISPSIPFVKITYSAGAMGYVTHGPGWFCTSAAVGREDCGASSTLGAGSTTTGLVTFTATGNPGDSADVTYFVQDLTGASNSDTSTESVNATVTGSIDNAGSYTKDAAVGAFGTKVGVDQVITEATIDKTYTFTDGPRIIKLFVPAEAIPFSSHIALYVGDPAYWSSKFSSQSKSYIDGYAVAWTSAGDSTGTTAASSVTLVVSDNNISGGDHLYQATTTGIGPAAGHVASGAWTASFTVDPGFVLGRTAAASATSTTTSTTSTIPGLPAAGESRVARQAPMPLVVLGILLVVAGTVMVGLRRRPA